MRLTHDILLWLTLLLISMILLIGTNEQRLAKANFLGSSVYYPLLSSLNHIEEIFHLRERKAILSEKLAETLLHVNSLEEELYTLKRIVDIQENFLWAPSQPHGFLVSSVVSHQGNISNRLLVIDKGRIDGVEVNFPVISEDGVVGRIINVFSSHSLVLPLINPLFKMGVISRKSNVQGLLESDAYGNTTMNMIHPGSQVSIDEVVITSSVSTFFPRGYPVGSITRLVKHPEDVYMRALVTPYAKINDLEQVIVLFYRKEIPDIY